MSEHDLTPHEHAELRSRLIAGSKRIRPVGKHRTTWIASAVAVVLVGGLSATAIGASNLLGADAPAPVATSSPDPTTATPAPAPTPAPTTSAAPPEASQPRRAFDGDCAQVLTADEIASAIGPDASARNDSSSLLATNDPLALLGGVSCTWYGVDSAYLGITVLDARAVVEEVSERYATMRCSTTSVACEKGREFGDVWVGAAVSPDIDDPRRELDPEEAARTDARLESLLAAVAARTEPAMAVATPRAAEWWTIPDCENVRATVQNTIGESMVQGFPGDSFPNGMTWDIVVGAGLDAWCSSYSTAESVRSIAEVHPQPGSGAPGAGILAGADVQPVEIVGADAAWIQVDPQRPSDIAVVAVVGPNRLSLRFQGDADPTRALDVAAAVLSELG